MKMLKQMLSKLIKEQKGQALPIVLVLLVLGGLVIAPTLRYASTSLKGHEVLERKGDELYAADSGIDYALFKLSNGETTINDYPLNGKTVSVNITDMGDGSYLITSTASSAGGSNTTIHTGVSSSGGFAYLLDNAITSNGDIIIKGEVSGNITYSDTLTIQAGGSLNGTPNQDPDLENSWPSIATMSTFYLAQVDGLIPYPDSYIDLADPSNSIIDPLYRQGSLDIDSTATGKNATLEGIVYVTQNLDFKQSGNKFYTIDLNGHTIFCESDITVSEACTMIGSGCIIAIGDVDYGPQSYVGSEDSFIFIMSITGETTLHPTGDFHGSVAGNTTVELFPNSSLLWNSIGGEGNLNFPSEIGVVGGSTEDMVLGGWDIG